MLLTHLCVKLQKLCQCHNRPHSQTPHHVRRLELIVSRFGLQTFAKERQKAAAAVAASVPSEEASADFQWEWEVPYHCVSLAEMEERLAQEAGLVYLQEQVCSSGETENLLGFPLKQHQSAGLRQFQTLSGVLCYGVRSVVYQAGKWALEHPHLNHHLVVFASVLAVEVEGRGELSLLVDGLPSRSACARLTG